MSNSDNTNHSQGFISGLFTGAVIGGALAYLAITPSGRRIVKQLLTIAEDLAEYGDEYIGMAKGSTQQSRKESSHKNVRSVLKKLERES
ncbi:MAG: YtxH domain-containing protein [Candidatus Roizmanbacteria bacterium]|nr:YtxH domain-containing protein [Candidatus Roizmanbacteria bacterium]